MIYMWFTGINYYKLAVEKDRDSIFTTITTIGSQASRYDGLKTQKLQNRRPLFDVELYLTVDKSFVSTLLNIRHDYSSWLHVSSQLSLLDDYFII